MLLAQSFFVAFTSAVGAQSYPSKPIRMVIPYPPGNSTSDVLGRALAQRLSSFVAQQVVVDNRPGAAGMIGTEVVVRSPADGYTILLGATGPNAINVSLYKKIPYDPIADLTPITLVATTTSVLVLNPSVPARTVPQLIALAKARPGGLSYGSAGMGSVNHLAGELFNLLAGTKLVHVPYKGMGPAVIDLLGGQIDLMFATMPGTIEHVKSGRLRALAVATRERSQVFPSLPTISEAGLPGFEASAFFGLFAPAKTPAEIVAKLHEQVARALKTPDVRQLYLSLGADPGGESPEEFALFIRSEIDKWSRLIKTAGMKPE